MDLVAQSLQTLGAMRFVEAVRRGDIASPIQRKFELRNWAEVGSRLAEDADDEHLMLVGVWFHSILSDLRTRAESSLWKAPWSCVARWLVGSTNRDYMTAMVSSIQAARGATTFHINAFDPRYQPHPNMPPVVSLLDLIETHVDLLDHGLRHARAVRGTFDSRATTTTLEELARVRVLASLYMEAERSFQDVLWLGSTLRVSRDSVVIVPRRGVEEHAWQASILREQSLHLEVEIRGRDLWKRSARFRGMWKESVGERPLFVARRSDGVSIVEMKRFLRSTPDEPPRGNQLRGFALYEYRELVNEPLPGLNGMTLSKVLTVHDNLAMVASAIWAQLPRATEVTELRNLETFSPVVDLSSLANAIASAARMPLAAVSFVLERLYWRPGPVLGTTWYRPIIRLDENQGVFVFLPLLASNPRRVIEWWLREGRLDLALRGKLFERILVESLKRAMDGRPLQDAVAIDSPGKLRASDGTTEEVDLTIRIGPLLVVGELKFNNQPDTATDRANYIGELRSAALQALRKADWVRQHLGDLEARIPIGSSAPLDGRVVPIVVTNFAIGAGLQLDGVPVLDGTLLGWYLARPYAEVAELHRDGLTRSRIGAPAYQTLTEMADAFVDFAKYPPPFARFHAILDAALVPLPVVAGRRIFALRYLQPDAPNVGPGRTVLADSSTRGLL